MEGKQLSAWISLQHQILIQTETVVESKDVS